METQNESALQKIHQLEDTSRYQRREEEDTIVRQAPRFITQLCGPTNLHEGQSATTNVALNLIQIQTSKSNGWYNYS